MKLGFVSAVLGDMSFEEVIDFAASEKFSCVEMCCWPSGGAQRRYAGVSHIDVSSLDDSKARYIKYYCAEKNVEISALAYYPNTMDADIEKREAYISHIKKLIAAAEKLGVKTVTTFTGRVSEKTIDENLEIFAQVWPPIIKYAEEHSVKIAIENCPMLFTKDEWPGGHNMAVSPKVFRQMFSIINSANFGLNFDPSHFIWQRMDYIKPIYDFKEKLFHIHFKDIKIHEDKLNDVGIMAPPLDYMSPKLPGYGDCNWGKFVSALTDVGYSGYCCIEIEDKSFEDSLENIKKSLILSKRYMDQFVI
ncbi:MAG: sugar phosphate isomerase/epimerase [Clostridiales bacterium]|nr:sugar phosphate isomerase/epimerase [Clostridiales bacterium]